MEFHMEEYHSVLDYAFYGVLRPLLGLGQRTVEDDFLL